MTAEMLRFTKMQGVGNDFVVVDGRKLVELDWPGLAVKLCERRFGVGADGLLVLSDTPMADFKMNMFNPDGSPDVCGNGLRCISRYAADRNIVSSDCMEILTLAGVREAKLNKDTHGIVHSVTVGMGLPLFAPVDIPMLVNGDRVFDFPLKLKDNEELTITALSTGSTHSIVFVGELPDDETFFRVSPLVENHPFFPERTSLMWCKAERPGLISMRIWERGAGETLGCGTGACAAGVAAILHGFAMPGEPVIIKSEGGELVIRWKDSEPIEMTGPAEYVYEGIYSLT